MNKIWSFWPDGDLCKTNLKLLIQTNNVLSGVLKLQKWINPQKISSRIWYFSKQSSNLYTKSHDSSSHSIWGNNKETKAFRKSAMEVSKIEGRTEVNQSGVIIACTCLCNEHLIKPSFIKLGFTTILSNSFSSSSTVVVYAIPLWF